MQSDGYDTKCVPTEMRSLLMARKQKTELDFSKYRTPDLIETITEIVGIPGAIRSIVKWTMYGVATLIVMTLLVLYLSGNLTFLWATFFEVYGAPTGAVAGFALGVAEFMRRSLSNMRKLVDLLLSTSIQVAQDVKGLSAGETELPPVRDLVEDVYEQVILVILRQVLGAMFGIIGTPIYWAYHLTMNQLVRITIRFLPSQTKKVDESQLMDANSTEVSTDSSAMAIDGANRLTESEQEAGVIASLRWTQEKLGGIGGRLSLMVLLPCYTIVLAVIGLLISPPFIVFWFFVRGS